MSLGWPLGMRFDVFPYSRSVLGILFAFWVMGFLIHKQKGFFFLPRGTGIKISLIGFKRSCLGILSEGFKGRPGHVAGHPTVLDELPISYCRALKSQGTDCPM